MIQPTGDLDSSVETDTVVAAETGESVVVALADGPELPVSAVAVELAEHDGRLEREVLTEVEARQLGAGAVVDDPDEGVLHLAEVLTALGGLVDRHRDGDPVGHRRDLVQLDADLLVVTVAGTGEVVTVVHDGAVGRGEVTVEHEVLVRQHLAGVVDDERRGVEVELRAGGGACVPAEGDGHAGQRTTGLLAEVDVAALLERNSHDDFLPWALYTRLQRRGVAVLMRRELQVLLTKHLEDAVRTSGPTYFDHMPAHIVRRRV